MLSKKELIELYRKKPKGLYQKIKHSHASLFEKIGEFEGKTFSEKAYKFCYQEKSFECSKQGCEKTANFKSFRKGFGDFCSKKCSNASDISKKKKRKTNIERYGNEHAIQNENVKAKRKKTNKEKYGGHPLSDPNVLQKQRKTNIRRYGVENVFQSESIKNQIEQTNKNRYGGHPMKTDEVKKNFRQSMVEKYGVNHPLKDPEIRNRHHESVKSSGKQKMLDFYHVIQNRVSNTAIPLFSKEEYEGIAGPSYYPFRCRECGNEFEDYLLGTFEVRCPVCFPKDGTSKAEKELEEFISSITDSSIITNDRKVLDGKEIDIYIPEKKTAIEFDGLYYHSESFGGKDRRYHLNKTEECEKKGIQLIHIFEDEWTHKREQVKDRLSYMIGDRSSNRLYARECEVREISTERKQSFLNENHLDGASRSSVKLGLFHCDELVSVMTFGQPSIAQNNDTNDGYELKRFASTCSVVGGASKMLSYFEKKYNPTKLITYCDRRWSVRPSVYDKIGFEYEGSSNPGYWYVKNGRRYHRYSFRKHVLNEKLETFDENKTEYENMLDNGYDRIWDCGQYKYFKTYI